MGKIAIVGAGMMGTALCWPLSDNRHSVNLIGTPLDEDIITSIQKDGLHPRLERKIPAGVRTYRHTELAEALERVDLIVSGVSSFGVDWFTRTVGPHFIPGVPVIAVTKGLQDLANGDLQILPDVINQGLSHLQNRVSLNAIGGPCIALELAARRPTCVVFCGRNQEILNDLQQVFATDYYHIWTSTDLVGVEVCAALKNAYAMGVCLAIGMLDLVGVDGLANMYNPQAALFAQSCLEMKRFLEIMGCQVDHILGLPGPGDLFVTVYGGRTARLGRLLGKGVSFSEARQQLAGVTLESVEIITRVARALPKLKTRGIVSPGQFPLLTHLDEIINQGKAVNLPWERFF